MKRPIRIDGAHAYVPLTQGREAIIDVADVSLVDGHTWWLGKGGYAVRVYKVNGKQTTVYMHRVISACPEGQEVDHIDGDGLNNRRSNLRNATKAQNAYNVGPRRTNTSGYKGVSLYLSLIHISEPTRPVCSSRMPSSA